MFFSTFYAFKQVLTTQNNCEILSLKITIYQNNTKIRIESLKGPLNITHCVSYKGNSYEFK